MFEDNLSEAVLAAGALGTAAFGIVEGLKVFPLLAEAGFTTLVKFLGPLMEALKTAYGPDSERLLRAQYRGDHINLTRTIRQGVRVGLTGSVADRLASSLGMVDAAKLKDAAEEVERGITLSDDSRNVLGRFELAVDARIDAGLTLALDHYVRAVRIAASFVAIAIGVLVGAYLGMLFEGVIVGIAAVPLAPVAKDIGTAIRSAAEALRARL
jgi:hypothetical protein